MLTVPLKDPSQDISLGIIMIANYDSPTTINSKQSISLEPVDIDEKNRKRRTARIRRDAFYHATEALLETYVLLQLLLYTHYIFFYYYIFFICTLYQFQAIFTLINQ
jgi:hypothetical protein